MMYYKRMSLEKFRDSYLSSNGVDAEDVKEEYVGKNGGGVDIYDGDTVTIRSKDGDVVIDTDMTKEEFFAWYSDSEDCNDDDDE